MNNNKTIFRSILIGLASAAALRIYLQFRRDQFSALQRLHMYGIVLETNLGPVEYAALGSGPTVFISHGSLGGYDQSLALKPLFPAHRIICPSRPGYLKTPLSIGATYPEQADIFASLLDRLGIADVIMVGASTGAFPAVEFVQRYPERCRGLILIGGGSLPPPPYSPALQLLKLPILAYDFPTWLVLRYCMDWLITALGTQLSDLAQLKENPTYYNATREILNTQLPSLRRTGQINDLLQANQYQLKDLDQIKTSTLLIHGTNDPLAPFSNAQQMSDQIPGASLLSIEGGGHLAIATHLKTIAPAIQEFIQSHRTPVS